MRYVPQQVKEITGLGQATLRHWRELLPPLKGRNGHTACFSVTDMLGLMVTDCLIEDSGVRISALAPVATKLWDICASLHWPKLKGRVLVFTSTSGGQIRLLGEDAKLRDVGRGAVAPIGALVAALERKLVHEEVPAQRPLALPPVGLTRGRFGERKAGR